MLPLAHAGAIGYGWLKGRAAACHAATQINRTLGRAERRARFQTDFKGVFSGRIREQRWRRHGREREEVRNFDLSAGRRLLVAKAKCKEASARGEQYLGT